MKIVLVGYMASGKSEVAKEISQKINIPVFDLDDIIEKTEGKTISAVFETKGELYFRKIENKILNDFLIEHSHFVLSLGGGTPCYANNHMFLQSSDIFSVYLKASPKELKNRLIMQREHRPLVVALEDSELEEYIAKHLFDRSFYYHQANHVVITDEKSVEEVADEIINLLQ